MVKPISRNTLAGFSERTLKNLAFMHAAKENGLDVHIVTHLIVSMLGLIVFPFEHIRRDRPEQLQIPLAVLAENGSPMFAITLGESDTLDNLIFHIRNALSHRRISFSSDRRELHEVESSSPTSSGRICLIIGARNSMPRRLLTSLSSSPNSSEPRQQS